MTLPFYTGDNVPLKFTITDATGPLTPTVVTVEILKPDNQKTSPIEAGIDDNQVSYDVPTSITDVDGKYKAYFVITLPGGLIRTHKIEFDITSSP